MMRKHGKPSFKFPKKEKQYKAIEEVNFLVSISAFNVVELVFRVKTF